MATKKNSLKIIKGPSTHVFIDAFKYAYDKDNAHTVRLTLAKRNGSRSEVRIMVTAIQHEDGSGGSFNYKGVALIPHPHKRSVTVTGYYDSKRSEGFMDFGEILLDELELMF